ncbi:MAG: DNA mismatch repair protein MutS [Spirochaetes bacterium GWF1_51_8]|nr:MAG: DNA mismatch repair protein MutS [Spirochaetes bacterium GWF1_51_8]
MERQYREIKSRHRDKILFFRLGDFYEMFDDDAREASRILNIALTARHDLPMCGFPYHAAQQYIQKLLQAGKKIAICEQLEDPALAKGIVKRDIVQIVTPGTVIDDQFVPRTSNNFLMTVFSGGEEFGISLADISTGEYYLVRAEKRDRYRVLQDEIARFTPSEILINQNIGEDPITMEIISASGALTQKNPEWYFHDFQYDRSIIETLKLSAAIENVTVLRKSVTGTMNYFCENQFASVNNFREIELLSHDDTVELDDFSLRNLELVRNMQDGGKKFTLLDVLDRTVTPMGARLLRRWIVMPLYNTKAIYRRQNFVEVFFDDSILRKDIYEAMRRMSDIERLTTRIALKKALPREMIALRNSLAACAELKSRILPLQGLAALVGGIPVTKNIENLIASAVKEEPSNSFGGDVIREGYSGDLDAVRNLLIDGKDWVIKLQHRERERTGISTLKIKYNNIFGYFIEISKANLDSVPPDYIRKQSLVNAERFTLPELSEYEMQITTAEEKVIKIEESLFKDLQEVIGKEIPLLQKLASTVAEIDCYHSLAVTASEFRYVKPIVDDSGMFSIVDGRHPVVEKYMGSNLFVPNDITMDDDENRILIVTGPNMAGKSTYLRQNALIAVMAQIGSFIPAKSAQIGMVDKIFTRIGASDQLSAGRSTFLVEMEEAANILNNMTSRSLIIMDELGRGTSTYDGLSIAWAVIEYLHENPGLSGKTLFATHYHELTQLGGKRGIVNFNIAVREFNDELIFLRKVIKGPADQSYGIYVAKLAGMREEIVARAKTILKTLEKEGTIAKNVIEHEHDKTGAKKKGKPDLELFAEDRYGNIIGKIKNIDIDRITPIEAITFLSEIKKDIEKD